MFRQECVSREQEGVFPSTRGTRTSLFAAAVALCGLQLSTTCFGGEDAFGDRGLSVACEFHTDAEIP